MKRAAAILAVGGALVLATAAHSGRTSTGGHGILLLSTESDARLQGFNPAWGKAGIAYVFDYRRIMLVSPATGRSKILAPVTASALAWSSRGELAALQPDRILLFTASGRELRLMHVPFKKTNACGIAWSPDGNRLLVRTSRRVNGLLIVTPGTGRWQRQSVAIGKSNFDNCALSWR